MKSSTEIAEAVRAGRVTARQMVEQCFAGIRQNNGPVNAFVYLDEQGALAAADVLDTRIADGEDPGRLAGVPFGIKDLKETCIGMPRKNGSLVTRDAVPDQQDSPQIARLKAAGAIAVRLPLDPLHRQGAARRVPDRGDRGRGAG